MAAKRNGAARQRQKAKPRGKGRQFRIGNPYAYKPGESGNPNGNAKSLLLSGAYHKLLGTAATLDTTATLEEMIDEGASWADVVAFAQIIEAAKGKTPAAAEIRAATEGSKVKVSTWRDEVIGLLRKKALTPDELRAELGDELAAELIVAAGVA